MKTIEKQENRSSPQHQRPFEKRAGGSCARGFSLVELLVVIGVIAVLAALLFPGLSRAKQKAKQTQCLNNQRQIGTAFKLYVDDCRGYFPVHDGWAAVGGQRPAEPFTAGHAFKNGGDEWETNRPLNQYIGNVAAFHCPADKGDPLIRNVGNCWERYGNSYLVQWNKSPFRVRYVTGSRGKLAPVHQSTSENRIGSSPANKIIQADWPWHPAWDQKRKIENTRGDWHGPPGQRTQIVLFGDAHAKLFKFPADLQVNEKVPYSSSYIFW